MSTFKKITLIGKGTFGSAVLPELLKAGFEVTVLSRSDKSNEDLPPNVRRITVDYNDKQHLCEALKSQDAVVSTVSGEAVLAQKPMIDAAIEAGVRRFIPADYGSLTTNPAATHFPHHVPMVEIQKYLESKAGEIEHTIFSIGGFTDFLVTYGVAFDWEHKMAQLWGDGSNPVSSTSMQGSARAIVGALKNPEPTKNKNLFIHELVVTQSQLLNLAKKYSPRAEWTVTKINDPLAEFDRLEAVAKESPDFPNIMALLQASIMSGKYQSYYQKIDNDLVGLPVLSEKDLEARFAEAYGSK